LHQDAQEAFENEVVRDAHSTIEVGHGRIEKRTTGVITNLDWICKASQWKSLHCIIRVEAIGENKKILEVQKSVRYYISSKKADAAFFHNAIRAHWSIENQLHWVLDVSFREDASKKHKANSAQNFSLLNKIALNMLKHYEDPSYKSAKKMSIKRKRKIAAWLNEPVFDMLFKNN